jgi:Spy/CpxP family protein refolding chaperone
MATNKTSPSRIRILTALLLFGVFFAGAVTGAGLFYWLGQPCPFGHPPGLPGPFSELDLSKEQERKVHKIFEKHHPELEAILQETFPKAREVFDKIDADVSVILTAEQRKKLDAFKRKHGPFPPAGIGPHERPPGLPPFGPLGGPPQFKRERGKRAKPRGTP